MSDADSLCGCGKPGRYMSMAGKDTGWACNKYMRCPTYDELSKTAIARFYRIDKLEKALTDIARIASYPPIDKAIMQIIDSAQQESSDG